MKRFPVRPERRWHPRIIGERNTQPRLLLPTTGSTLHAPTGRFARRRQAVHS